MKINLTRELDRDTLITHIILNNMSQSIAERLAKEGKTPDGVVVDVKLTVNGIEIDLKSFVDYWQSQVDSIITSKARELINDKFADLNDMFYDLEERLRPEIDKRLDDWEKEFDNTGNDTVGSKESNNK